MRKGVGWSAIAFTLLAASMCPWAYAFGPRTPYSITVYDEEAGVHVDALERGKEYTIGGIFCIYPQLNRELIEIYAEDGFMAFTDKIMELRGLDLCEWATHSGVSFSWSPPVLVEAVNRGDGFIPSEEELVSLVIMNVVIDDKWNPSPNPSVYLTIPTSYTGRP